MSHWTWKDTAVEVLMKPFNHFLLFPAIFFVLTASALAQDEPVEVKTPSTKEVIRADYLATSLFHNRITDIREGEIYLFNKKVRFEPKAENGTTGYQNVFLYNFKENKMRRIFPQDKIFFEIDLSEKTRIKAMRDGWIPWKDFPEVERRWIKLKEDVVNGQACVLELLERRVEVKSKKKRKKPQFLYDYSLYWKATDLDGLPVRIVYFLRGGTVVIVNYNDIKTEEMDASLFLPPENFVSLSPF